MKLPEIPRRVKLLTLAIFFADASHSTVIPILPGYARNLGTSLTILGTYGSAAAITMLVLSLPLGRLSDRLGRKTMMTPGLILFTIVCIFFYGIKGIFPASLFYVLLSLFQNILIKKPVS